MEWNQFIGGIFVEYLAGSEEIEYRRGKVTECAMDNDGILKVKTDNGAYFDAEPENLTYDSICRFSCMQAIYYAMAPKGIEIECKGTFSHKYFTEEPQPEFYIEEIKF